MSVQMIQVTSYSEKHN